MGAINPSSKEKKIIKQNTKKIPPKEVEFKIHIAIDFGTDGCALAYAYNGEVTVYNKWKTKKRQRTMKAKSEILLNDKNKVVAFGDDAKIIYSSLSGDEKIKWKFFDKFKMSLYEKDVKATKSNQDDQKANNSKVKNKSTKTSRSTKMSERPDIAEYRASVKAINDDEKEDASFYLKSMNGLSSKADIVFVSAFEHLQKIALEYMEKITDKRSIKKEEIQWIITVPAIWSENAKSKMKQWITKAGLIEEHIIDQCLIVYEPDCAAMAMFEEIKQQISEQKLKVQANALDSSENKQDADNAPDQIPDKVSKVSQSDKPETNEFKEGDIYILVDAGGGTVDIACHKVIINTDGVEEIHYPTGGNWGSCYVDDEYIKFLRGIFGVEWMNEFKKMSPNIYLEIIDNFQIAKSKFYKQKKAATHSVELPYEFVQYLHTKCSECDETIESRLTKYTDPSINKNDDIEVKKQMEFVRLNGEELIINVIIWKRIFDTLINPIIVHIAKLLEKPELKDCKFLGLVGGFSCSKYFQFRMKKTFGIDSKYKLIPKIPKKPSLSVVTGAAYFGWNYKKKDFIQSRRLKYTYGILVNFKKQKAQQLGISERYINMNTNKRGKVVHCFEILAAKNEPVAINELRTFTGYSYGPGSQLMVEVICSDQLHPKTVNDGTMLAKFAVPGVKEENTIIVEFHFYGTMFTVYAYPKGKAHNKKSAQINYIR